MITLPKAGRGRRSAAREAQYQEELAAFCEGILEIRARLDFDVSARGWCYMLEKDGLLKGDFDAAERLICECRKLGLLPFDIVADDSARQWDGLEYVDDTSPEEEAAGIIKDISYAHLHYQPVSFWENQDCYLELLAEKVDLKGLFAPICERYSIPIANARGTWDLNMRVAMIRRFQHWEQRGKQCVLLYCGDHDPSGLVIGERLKDNIKDTVAAGWDPRNLVVDRFGLNFDFIAENGLTWIDNLATGSGKDLADPTHHDHHKPYVQDYLERFGVRKCEANALVVAREAGRRLCEEAIEKYVDQDAVIEFKRAIDDAREEVRREIADRMEAGQW